MQVAQGSAQDRTASTTDMHAPQLRFGVCDAEPKVELTEARNSLATQVSGYPMDGASSRN